MNNIVSIIKQHSVQVVCFGPVGRLHFGTLIATLAAVPVIYFFHFLNAFHTNLFYVQFCIIVALVGLTIQASLSTPSLNDSNSIVIDKALGFFFVFLFITPNIKLLVLGYVFFHILNFFQPFLMYKLLRVNLEQLPGALGVLAGDVVSGITVNLFFAIVFWIAH